MKILLVEDDIVTGTRLAALLRRQPDIDVVWYRTGPATLETLKAGYQPDILVLDLMLNVPPAETGTRLAQTIHRLRKELATVPVVLITAAEPAQVVEHLVDLTVLYKPFTVAALLQAIHVAAQKASLPQDENL